MIRSESSYKESDAPPIKQLAAAIRDKLEGLGRLSVKAKRFPVALEDSKELVLTLKPLRWKHGWQIRISNQSTCPQCRKIRKSHSITYVEALPGIGELSDWLNRLVQLHVADHHKVVVPPPSAEEPARDVIRVQSTEDKNSTRIKVLSATTESVPHIGLSQTSQPPRIKINELSANVAAPSTVKVQSRSSGQRTQPDSESIRNAPCIRYMLASGDAIEVTFPVSICNFLIQHCRSSLENGREVGGVFIGVKTEGSTTSAREIGIIVTDLIHFRPADSSGDRLHLTSDSWAHVGQVESERGYEGQQKVRLGWYHTHPTQGIFFSRYDKDFHTVFSKPFQFAIVIDPQRMEAGLFYWDDSGDQSGHRSLVATSTFRLKRDQEAEAELHRVVAVQPVEPLRRKIAWQRVLFLTILVFSVFITALLDNTLTWGPDQVTLVAAMILVVLVLWNAHWFRPEHAIEQRSLMQLQLMIDRLRPSPHQPAPQTKRPRRLSGKILAALLTSLILVAVGVGVVRNKIRQQSASHSNKSEAGPLPLRSPTPFTSRDEITISISMAQGVVTLADSKNQGVTPLSYEFTSNQWTCDADAEKRFFQAVFNWDVQENKSQEYIKPLQVILKLTNSPDGKWGPHTRNAFIKAAIDHKDDQKGIAMNLSDGAKAQVLFQSSPQ